MRKDDINRLSRILKELDEREKILQNRHGERIKGSIRSRDVRDANAIRRILKEITGENK